MDVGLTRHKRRSYETQNAVLRDTQCVSSKEQKVQEEQSAAPPPAPSTFSTRQYRGVSYVELMFPRVRCFSKGSRPGGPAFSGRRRDKSDPSSSRTLPFFFRWGVPFSRWDPQTGGHCPLGRVPVAPSMC
jgi:hypothetical protein